MLIANTIKEVREVTSSWRKQELSIGLVPTMGFIHDGHKSLMERARIENEKVVVSIFVNPLQFGPAEDYEKYPRDLEHDKKVCKEAGIDLIFVPTVSEMYPSRNFAYVDIEELGNGLCGAKRPGHFRGVCTVVSKLFNIVLPDRAYFGEKDAQQLAIIKRMVKDLNFDIDIVACPTVREPDGLAMSSRNSYLSSEERKAALTISKSLKLAKAALSGNEKNADSIKKIVCDELSRERLIRIDYVDIVNPDTLEPITQIDGPVLVAVAAFVGRTRLIDNFFGSVNLV
jgi:pantoate--beta-alanine ligase